MAFRLLLIEDEDEIAQFVSQGLREEGYDVCRAANGHEAEREIAARDWDLIILDWWLPGLDGLSIVRNVRAAKRTTPLLFLTARDSVQDRVEGLRAGADDYLCKPFAFEELLARVEALIRRGVSGSRMECRHRDVVVDLESNQAYRGSHLLALTAREQALLVYFLRHAYKVLSRSELYEQVWQEQYDGLSNTLEVHVMELRRKMEAFGPRLIRTVRGQGYILGDPITDQQA